MAELALVREAGAGGDLRQGQVGSCLQELLGPLDAAGDVVQLAGVLALAAACQRGGAGT